MTVRVLRGCVAQVIPATVVLAAVTFALCDLPGWGGWDYRRERVLAGSWWCLLTAHVAHLDERHLLTNLTGFVLVAWIFSADLDVFDEIAALLFGVVAIDAALWFLHPEVSSYAGLSGVVHAWFALGATCWLLDRTDTSRRYWGFALWVGLGVKLGCEASDLAFWRNDWSMPVIDAAHRWGALGGVLAGVVAAKRHRYAKR